MTPTGQPVRVCIFFEGETVPRWVAESVKMLRTRGCGELVLAVRVETSAAGDEHAHRPRRGGWARRLLDAYRFALFDRPLRQCSATTRVGLGTELAGVELATCTEREWQGDGEAAWMRSFSDFSIDVGLCLNVRRPRGDWVGHARVGLWQLRHGEGLDGDAPVGFWEVMLARPITRATLYQLGTDAVDDQPLASVRSCTVPFSVLENEASAHWNGLPLIPRTLSKLQRLGAADFMEQTRQSGPGPQLHSERPHGVPGNLKYAGKLLRMTFRKAAHILRNRLYFEQWILLYRFDAHPGFDLTTFERLVPPPDRIWADPFAIEESGRHYIFFEEMPLETRVGHISVIEIDAAGNPGPARVVLRSPHHLSYPFLFRFEGSLYMIPESGASRNVALYRCTGLPDQWEFVHNMLEGVRAYDVTLTQRDGRWWLFAGMVDSEGASSWNDLFLFHADSPLSRDWIPHPENPVKSDCRSARPAGALFEHDGALYRPSQNCAPRYGYGLNLARVERLDETGYGERVVSQAFPEWDRDLVATHTWNRSGSLQVIDAQIRRRRF